MRLRAEAIDEPPTAGEALIGLAALGVVVTVWAARRYGHTVLEKVTDRLGPSRPDGHYLEITGLHVERAQSTQGDTED